MKRATRKVEKRTFTLKNAIPRFVSLVSRGANFTPLAELRYEDGEAKFSDVEINKIVFSKDNFSAEGVEQYLQENDYEDCTVEETDAAYVVQGVEAEQFEDISPIEYGDGVQFYVGKLKTPTEVSQVTAEVENSEVLDFSDETTNTVEEVVNEEVEQADENAFSEEGTSTDEAGEEQEEQEVTTEEVVTEGEPEAVGSEEPEAEIVAESQPVFDEAQFREKALAALEVFFSALEAAKTESFSVPETTEEAEVTYSQEQVDALVEEAIAKFKEENDKTVENTIDETPIVVQNSQVIATEEISSENSKDETTEKFSQRKHNDLFGLR